MENAITPSIEDLVGCAPKAGDVPYFDGKCWSYVNLSNPEPKKIFVTDILNCVKDIECPEVALSCELEIDRQGIEPPHVGDSYYLTWTITGSYTNSPTIDIDGVPFAITSPSGQVLITPTTTGEQHYFLGVSNDTERSSCDAYIDVFPLEPIGFKTEWTVSGEGRTIHLPFVDGYTYNCVVDRGDGTPTQNIIARNDANTSHTYAVDGVYVVTLTGIYEARSFNYGSGCGQCTGVLDRGTGAGFVYLSYGFAGCSNLTTLAGTHKIPSNGLASVDNLFKDCTSLTTIPAGIFDLCIDMGAFAFQQTFMGCTSLTAVPTNLFKFNVGVHLGAFYATFQDCINLATVPNYLFRYNTRVSGPGFGSTFLNCNKLQIPERLFLAPGEEGARFSVVDCDFGACFERHTFTGSIGVAPAIWSYTFMGMPTQAGANAFSGAGNSLTSLSNYASIPAGRK